MDLDEALEQLLEEIPEENRGKAEKIIGQVADEWNGLIDDLKAANAESKERKLKLREMQTQLDEAGEKVKEFEGKVNDPAQKQELDALKQFKADVLKVRRESFSGEFAKIAKHPNFEKAKEQFKLPKPSESGEYDFTKAADADIEHNLAKMAEYNKIGFFGETEQSPAGGFNLPRQGGSGEPPKIQNTGDLQAHIAAQMAKFK